MRTQVIVRIRYNLGVESVLILINFMFFKIKMSLTQTIHALRSIMENGWKIAREKNLLLL